MIKATGSHGEVVKLIQKVFDEDGILMTVEDAAKLVEEELVSEYLKYSKLNKIAKKINPQPAPAASQAAAPASQQGAPSESPKQPQPAKTLSNNMASSRPLTARERAILAAEGKLGK
jgi:hypothetical protein